MHIADAVILLKSNAHAPLIIGIIRADTVDTYSLFGCGHTEKCRILSLSQRIKNVHVSGDFKYFDGNIRNKVVKPDKSTQLPADYLINILESMGVTSICMKNFFVEETESYEKGLYQILLSCLDFQILSTNSSPTLLYKFGYYYYYYYQDI